MRLSQEKHPNLKEPVSRLPTELFLDILDIAQYDDIQPRYRWLKHYCLVCRSWRTRAQQLLFTTVVLNAGRHQCKAFINALAAAQSRDPEHALFLQASVRTLVMAMDHQSIYVDILAMCYKLRELRVTLYHAAFRSEVLQKLARCPSIQALYVRALHPLPLFQLLCEIPSVEYLEVDSNGALFELPDCAPPWRLRELRYHNAGRSTHSFVEWALSGPSRETLEVLQATCSSFEISTPIRLGVAPRIRSLCMRSPREADELSPFVQLLTLEVRIIHRQRARALFRSIPPSVVHIVLHAMDIMTCAEVMSGLISCQARGSLRVLTYNRNPITTGNDTWDDAKLFYTFCAQHGLEFHLMSPAYGYFAGERTPLTYVDNFPRPLPLSSHRDLLTEGKLPWDIKKAISLPRKIVTIASRAFNSPLPPVALAKP